MSDFKEKMHQIRFRLGLRIDPAGTRSPAAFKGPTFNRRGEKCVGRKGREQRRRGRDEVDGGVGRRD